MFDKFKQLGELKKLRDQAMALQKELAKEEIEVEEHGVKIVMTANQKLKEILVSKGIEKSKEFDWKETARKTLMVFR